VSDSTFADRRTEEPHGLKRLWRDPQTQGRISTGFYLGGIGFSSVPLVFFIAVNRFYPDDGLFRAAEFVSRVGFVVFVPCALSLMFLGGVAGFGIGWNVVRKLEQVQHWTRAKGAMLGAAAIGIPSLEMFLFFLLAPVGSSLRSVVLIGFAAITISISGAILGAIVVELFTKFGVRPSAEDRRAARRLYWRQQFAALLVLALGAAAVVYVWMTEQ